MSAPSAARSGVLEGGARVLREVLRTPRVRATLEVLRRELDPEHAPLLVQALTEDQGVFLDGLATTPKVANALIAAFRELALRLGELPPELLRGVTRRLAAEVDVEGAGAALGAALALSRSLPTDPPRGAERFVSGLEEGLASAGADAGAVAEGAARWAVRRAVAGLAVAADRAGEEGSPSARAVAAAAAEIRKAGRDHPALVAHVVRPLLDALVEAAGRGDEEEEVHHAE